MIASTIVTSWIAPVLAVLLVRASIDPRLIFSHGFAFPPKPSPVAGVRLEQSIFKQTSATTTAKTAATRALLAGTVMADQREVRFITNKMCPFAQKVWIALEKCEIHYRLDEISLYGTNGKPDWFWNLNPKGTVPVLVYHEGDNGSTQSKPIVLTDSDMILNHMEQGRVPGCQILTLPPLLTATQQPLPSPPPPDEMIIQQWRRQLVNNQLLPQGKKSVLSGSLSSNVKSVLSEMNHRTVGPYLTGTTFTTADCHTFPFVWRLHQEFDLSSSYPNLVQWLDKCAKEEPAVRQTIQSSWWWWW